MLKGQYLGESKGNLKQGNTYFINKYDDTNFRRKVVFIYADESLNNCVGLIDYSKEEWNIL